MNIIEAKNITKRYGGVTAVHNLSISVKKGEFYGLLGPNGSGKTTTIKLLTGQLKSETGSIKVLGVDVLKNPVGVREVIGIIPEQETPPSFLTAEEYLFLVCRIRRLNNAKRLCDYWFNFLDFEDSRRVLCKDLSRGTRQKLMFAQAFIHEPKVAFIDEPLINLDPIIQKKIKEFLVNYVNDENTVFFSTHILSIAQELCTRIGILNNGRLVFEGSVKEAAKKHSSLEKLFIDEIMGDSNARTI